MIQSRFQFAPDILRRLGEELVPHPDQGIIELVKNSYDADARRCEVELLGTESPGGSFVVRDDGKGMTRSDLENGWLVVGRSRKNVGAVTKLGRIPVGDKGLGRLAALRLGESVEVITKAEDEERAYHLAFSWSQFDAAATVESVDLQIATREATQERGTTVIVKSLRVPLGRREVHRLARSLILLGNPFHDDYGFRPTLKSSAFTDLEARVADSYFEDAEYHLVADLLPNGESLASVNDWKGNVLWSAKTADFTKKPYAAPRVRFDLWVFLLSAKEFLARRATLGEVREWLEVVGGVHLYHNGIRVHPYGDPGHDWLDMNLARARAPEFRPSTNTSIGRIDISDPDALLRQKTDRTGFIEDEPFREIRRFATDALNWMAHKRLAEAERKRQTKRVQAPPRSARAREAAEQVVRALPPKSRAAVAHAIKKLEDARERETAALREDLQLYRTLGTVGTTVAVFSHESAKPVTQIDKMAEVVDREARKSMGAAYKTVERPLDLIRRAARSLKTFAALPISLLQREKRRSSQVDVNQVIRGLVHSFTPFAEESKIKLEAVLTSDRPLIRGSIASIEAIVTNLVTNSINAIRYAASPSLARRIEVETSVAEGNATIVVRDSGPGIVGLELDEIWLPGRTTTPGGTGLGLTIVKDAVIDLAGEVDANATGKLGGAEFTVTLPLL